MKKAALLFLMVFTSFAFIKAQSKVHWGVTGGVNISTEGSSYEFTPGINMGGFMEFQFSKSGFLSSSLLLSQKGYSDKGPSVYFDQENGIIEGEKYSIKKKNYYLELPIHLGYNLNISKLVSLKLSAGPYLAMGLWGDVKNKKNNDFSYSLYGRESYRRFDYGIGGKLKLELYKHYQIGFGYDLGLIRTHKEWNLGHRNQNMTVSVGYLF